jgi:hypothetical protein
MSTAFFGQGLESYNNSRFAPFTAEYTSWKGTGQYSYPVAITSGNIRPLTNNDPTNNAPQKPGLPRPLKWQYRKGTTSQKYITVINPAKPNQYIEVNRESKSSKLSSLIGQTIDQPGRFSVKHNPIDEVDEQTQLDKDCKTCHGVGLVTSFAPETYLTNNPQANVCTPQLCCNEEQKALNRVIYASTNLKKNYYNTHQQYRENRCQTYDQKAFNFYSGPELPAFYARLAAKDPELAKKVRLAKPGDPLSLMNTYVANCYPNEDPSISHQITVINTLFNLMNNASVFTPADVQLFKSSRLKNVGDFNNLFLKNISGNKILAQTLLQGFANNPNYVGLFTGPSNYRGCKSVVYKPSNPQFAVQGGVSSSTRTLKLTVDTIGSSIASIRRLKGQNGPFLYKNKAPACNPAVYMKNGNPKTCFRSGADDHMYKAFSKLGNIGGSVNGTQVTNADMAGAIL